MHRREIRLLIVAAAAAVVLGVLSTLGMAVAAGAFAHPPLWAGSSWSARCGVPALTGTVVNATVTDMGGMMRGSYQPGPMMRGPYQLDSGANPAWWHHPGMGGMMRIFATPGNVPHGPASIRIINAGAWTHELVVLPPPGGQGTGQRPIGADGKSMKPVISVKLHVPAARDPGTASSPLRPVGPR
jgi:hypothetical protein